MRAPVILLIPILSFCLTGCFSSYCDSPYVTSEVWLANGTSEPLYYTFSDNPRLTPDCKVRQLPVKLAYILDFRRFNPSYVLAHPTHTANSHDFTGEEEGYYRYMLLLRYDNTLVACYDVSRPTLATANYPWFSPEANNTEVRYDTLTDCHRFEAVYETTHIYTYYITDSIL